MKYLLLLTLLMGTGFGQAKPVETKPKLADFWMGHSEQQMRPMTVDLDCDSFIDFEPWGKAGTPHYPAHPKAIKDIFPEECGETVTLTPEQAKCLDADGRVTKEGCAAYLTGHPGAVDIRLPIALKAEKNPDLVWADPSGTRPLTCKIDSTKTGWACKIELKQAAPESPDVPAIKIGSVMVCRKRLGCTTTEGEELPTYSCADKSRILLTAEDGTHHCVKFK
jgi:hypothetical protein